MKRIDFSLAAVAVENVLGRELTAQDCTILRRCILEYHRVLQDAERRQVYEDRRPGQAPRKRAR